MTHRSIEAKLDFLTPVEEIKGLGPKRAQAFYEAGIFTLGDILYHFPTRYIDRSNIKMIDMLEKSLGIICTVKATVLRVRYEPGRKSRLRVLVSDSSGELELLWFQGAQYYRSMIKQDTVLLATGKVTKYGHIQMVHPVIETVDTDNENGFKKFVPQYALTTMMREAGVQQKVFSKAIQWALQNLRHYPRVLPAQLEQKKKFPPLQTCLRGIHLPSSLQELEIFRSRITYEELFKTAVTLFFSKKKFKQPGRSMKPGMLYERFIIQLPFDLTEDQKAAVSELYNDAKSGSRMHRLLQGDVGSG
ncbi:MAG: hypothetical protein GX640_13245, partial [Fibrobacter sp.]|nr:hypothetical protein [Fibrobacter sp.]